MELTDIQPNNTTLEIVHPATGVPIGLLLTLQSMDAAPIKRIERRVIDDAQKLRVRGKFLKADDIENNSLDLAVATVTAWKWHSELTFKGDKNPEFTTDNVRAVLSSYPWIIRQIDEALGDEKRFFRPS